MYDLIIIGSGPAGLTAAIYATRAKLDFIIIEQNFMSGGQVVNTYEVDNYPATPGINGMDLSMKMREHAEGLGAVFVTEAVTSVDLTGDVKKVVTMDNEYEAKTVILATGAEHRKLGIPGELELAGMGVSYCATCDGAFFRGKDVAVVGGGDVAVEDAIFLARLCNKVYVIHRRDELRAAKVLQDRLLSLPNVEMCWSYHAKSIEGEGGMVTKLNIMSAKDGSEKTLDVSGVFMAVGIQPTNELFTEQLETDKGGYIVAGEDGKTNLPGVFAAGDLRTKQLRQIITACADGANAVTSVQEYLLTH
ncbi:MAG TPA: thioredoxin-disulfide reductase [Lachnospiraceae bacterium]|nr:thioredoxin-disulfide reductase [Lachnospiraceae bacterium]